MVMQEVLSVFLQRSGFQLRVLDTGSCTTPCMNDVLSASCAGFHVLTCGRITDLPGGGQNNRQTEGKILADQQSRLKMLRKANKVNPYNVEP